MEISTEKNSVGYPADYNETLLECCFCRCSLNDPVMLKCLHNCCRSCFESSTLETQTLNPSSLVQCPLCADASERSEIMSNSLLYNYKRLSTLSLETVSCNTCDAGDVAAVFWCADCCMGLCEHCYSWHNKFNRRHRSAELDVSRTWSFSQLTPAAQCSIHKRQMDVQCFTCRGPKCLLCYESCRTGKHELKPLSHRETMKHSSVVIDAVRASRNRLSRTVSGLLKKCLDVTSRLHGVHAADGHRIISQHKRSLHGATVNAFDTTVRQVCVNLQRIWDMCTTVLLTRSSLCEVNRASDNSEMLSFESLEAIRLLNERHLLKKSFNRCILELRETLMRRRKYWKENGAFSIDGSVSLTADIVLRSCLGATQLRRAAPPVPLLFGQVSVTFRTPVDCLDFAVTRDGHVLLAALQHGLLVYSDRGQQLSSWRPARLSDGRDDEVNCVAALSSGGAAVGVGHAQLVVLLTLNQTGDTWLQDRCVTVLQSPPWRLAAHGDLLAATEARRDEQQLLLVAGRELKLLKLSSGQVLYTQSRDYDIASVALTALCVVTTSSGPVKRNSGATPHVLDAFSHSGEFLWRHETSDEEGVTGLCVSADTWSRVYVTVLRSDRSSRVMAIGGADGRDSREVLSSRTHRLQLPLWLSLARGQQRTVLAVLSLNRTAAQCRTVSLYEATS